MPVVLGIRPRSHKHLIFSLYLLTTIPPPKFNFYLNFSILGTSLTSELHTAVLCSAPQTFPQEIALTAEQCECGTPGGVDI